jgi:nanoRNase/pAp phosphatase (c-di-AMP/oligoRNAs hydrolase)
MTHTPKTESTKAGLPEPLDRFGAAIDGYKRVLVYCHMNPDPDSLGSGLAMRQILREVYGVEAGVCYRGLIGRAENRRMVELLAPDMKHARAIDQSMWDAAILVDAQPDYGYTNASDRLPLVACVDHHPFVHSTSRLPYYDVRKGYGSTCTIMTEYLRAFGLSPDPLVATGLYYGIKTDTLDLTRRAFEPDVRAYEWLLRRVDRDILGKIQNPPLKVAYFEELRKAIGRAVVYDSVILTELGHVSYPDMVAEIADRLIRVEDAKWSVCFGFHEKRIYLSVRTNRVDEDAGQLVKRVLGSDGVGGGHALMAAGRVDLGEECKDLYLEKVSELWRRFLVEVGDDAASARLLVSDDGSERRVRVGAPVDVQAS